MAVSQRPTNPSSLKVNDKAAVDNQATKSKTRVKVTAGTRDPQDQDVRIIVQFHEAETGKGFQRSKAKTRRSEYRHSPDKGLADCVVWLENLTQNTRYVMRVWAEDRAGHVSDHYNASSFWTNRFPDPPQLLTPKNNQQFLVSSLTHFSWSFHDPDPDEKQSKAQLRYRTVSSGGVKGNWVTVQITGKAESWNAPANRFKSNTFYEWTVRTADKTSGHYGDWTDPPFSFFGTGTTKPPLPIQPIRGEAVDVTDPVVFDWRFRDPSRTDHQVRADIRWRSVDADAKADEEEPPYWNTVIGAADPGQPGTATTWRFPAGTFAYPGYRYEWQVRTYDSAVAQPSDWSDSAFFHSIGAPGSSAAPPPVLDPNVIQGSLGCGTYRVCLYDQGGRQYRGEITPIASLQFGRLRDDISTALLTTIGFGSDCGQLLKRMRSWMHEVVIFRDGVRVWEGPITRIMYTRDSVEVEAKDCMAYLYRRIMRQGYNDGFAYAYVRNDRGELVRRKAPSETAHGRSVVFRAYQIALNALAYHDPNLLPYLTAYINDFVGPGGDARQARNVPDYSQTAWQQIDDLAANAGLDYVTIGRRIMFWDTHRAIGRLPEMRDGDFSDPPVVTEYGMQTCTYSAVTNNTGVWGAVQKVTNRDHNSPGFNDWYGPIEMLASSFSETEHSVANMEKQANSNIAHRWPTPVVVRVPDNSTLNPDVNVGFEQLIPGVWIPLRSDATLRTVEQWQKLDSVTVTSDPSGEKVAVVMSPAPNGGLDPDAGAATETEE